MNGPMQAPMQVPQVKLGAFGNFQAKHKMVSTRPTGVPGTPGSPNGGMAR